MILNAQKLIPALLALLTGCLPLKREATRNPIPELELIAAYPLETPRYLEPSGLAIHQGELFTIADKVDNKIYRIVIGEDTAKLMTAVAFRPPAPGPMDWEGIAADPAGSLYLISEERSRLVRVTQDGTTTWASPDLTPYAKAAGLLAKDNAGLEGIAWLGPNHWLAAVEREPRGLVEWQGIGETVEVSAQLHQDSPFKQALPLLRLPDFAGLHADGSRIFALFRNAHLLVQIEKVDNEWQESAAWSYAHIEKDPKWAYRAQTYGQAEGIVVSGSDVYIIFDNNLGPRVSDITDRRPLLVHARIPQSP